MGTSAAERGRTVDRKTVRAVVVAILVFLALCAAQEFAGPPHPDRPRRGIIGWVLRGVVWHLIWGEPTPVNPATPDEAPVDEPKRNTPAEAPRRSIAGGQAIPDYAEGW